LDPELHLLRDLIRSFFPDYLRLVEPDAAAEMRLDQVALHRNHLDGASVVADVPGRNGEEKVTVLVQIEPEALPDSSLRIRQSLRSLRLSYGEPVLASVVYLRGGLPGIHLDSGLLAEALRIEMVRIYFTTFGLAETRAEHFLERPEPLAWALAARMRPTRRAPDEHRRACLERIAAAALDEKRRALLRRGVETFLGGRPSAHERSIAALQGLVYP